MRSLFQEPTITYCEAAIDWVIRRPWYALSNLSFFIAAVGVYRKDRSNLGHLFSATILIVGLLSFLYDATYLYVFQLLDLSGMLLFINLLIWLNLMRLFPGGKFISLQTSVGIVSMVAIIYSGGYTGNIIFGLYVSCLIVSQMTLFARGLHTGTRQWILSFVIFLLGFGVWILDASKIGCAEIGLLNGRAIFHYTSALVMYRLFIFYKSQTTRSRGMPS